MHKVFRVERGRTLHVIHETKTGNSRRNVYILCHDEQRYGEHEKGTPTCLTCRTLDDPCDLSTHEINHFTRAIVNDPSLKNYRGEASTHAKLIKRDLLDTDNNLTRRGKILALDWQLGPAPASSVLGVVHAREPLSPFPRCDRAGTLGGFDRVSLDQYERLRKLDLHITCIACLRQQS